MVAGPPAPNPRVTYKVGATENKQEIFLELSTDLITKSTVRAIMTSSMAARLIHQLKLACEASR